MKIDEKDEYQDFSELFNESKADLSSYIDKRIKLAKLKIYEKLASTSSYIMYSLIMTIFVLVLLILLLLGIGLFIGQLLNNYSAGFGILIIITLALLVLTFVFRKSLRKSFVNLTIRTIKKIEQDED